jgi:ABC-type bacteriocin/lantibiotic exporter with double-glycine peptidase domain
MEEPDEIGDKLCRFYRMLQIHHRVANELVGLILPPMMSCAELLIILTAYSIVIHLNPVVTWIALWVMICATIILLFALRYAVISTEISQTYIEVVKHIEPPKALTKAQRKFFRSLYPLNWTVGFGGNGFRITKETIPTVFQDIIIANLINLIIGTKDV